MYFIFIDCLKQSKLLILAILLLLHAPVLAQNNVSPDANLLTIDAVLAQWDIEHATFSPDGAQVAIVVRRPASEGEVYGRQAYEIDPSRNDIWIVSTKTYEVTKITDGRSTASGYWCPAWSPDGKHIAMLSTQSEGHEPVGGDNVHLYLWSQHDQSLRRLGDEPIITHTRYGSGLYKLDLRGGADYGTAAHTCLERDENAPFLWLNNHDLLRADLPEGHVSGLIDQYGRPTRTGVSEAAILRRGGSTAEPVSSGAARNAEAGVGHNTILRTFDIRSFESDALAKIPIYPFRGALTISVSPDGRNLALFPTVAAIQPTANEKMANTFDDFWTVQRRLGFINIADRGQARWANMPPNSRYPLELYGWSPNSTDIAFRGRAAQSSQATPLFIANAQSGEVTHLGLSSVGGARASLWPPHEPASVWVDSQTLIVNGKMHEEEPRNEWLQVDLTGSAKAEVALESRPGVVFRRGPTGKLFAVSGKSVLAFDPEAKKFKMLRSYNDNLAVYGSSDTGRSSGMALLAITTDDGSTTFGELSLSDGSIGPTMPINGTKLLDISDNTAGVLLVDKSINGFYARTVSLREGTTNDLASVNASMSELLLGETQLISYQTKLGTELEAAVILPPGYDKGKTYPTLLWVYPGHKIWGKNDYWLDPLLPGLYNLQTYAAEGYIVLIPSIPWAFDGNSISAYEQTLDPVIAALDKAIELGLSDPERVGVMGQSRGGYGVFALVTQTDRFKAAVSIAGIGDLNDFYGHFDPTGRGYPQIAHEKSDNWAQVDQFGLMAPPAEGSADYAANSPITYVDRVDTPLLMLHGDLDMRGSIQQSEEFFYSLYQQGKTARLVRYGGESHSLAQSPGNIRDAHERAIAWLDTYLRENAVASPEPKE